MKRVKGSVKKFYPQIREMHKHGMSPQKIGDALGFGRQTINNAINIMGLSKKRKKEEEENLVYAENKPIVFEKVFVSGKMYTDNTPLFAPR